MNLIAAQSVEPENGPSTPYLGKTKFPAVNSILSSVLNTPNPTNISGRCDDQGNQQLDNSDLGMIIEIGTPNPNNQRKANLKQTTAEMKRTGTFGNFK